MKQKFLLLTIMVVSGVIYSNSSMAQKAGTSPAKTDSAAVARTKYVSKQLGVDNAKASDVNTTLDGYKNQVKQVMADNSLTDAQKRAKIDGLIDKKNTKLKTILTAKQAQQIIPLSEQQQSPASTAKP